jgi:hypothetical protein
MERADRQIGKIEKERREELRRLRALSMGIILLCLAVDVVGSINYVYEFLKPLWSPTVFNVFMNLANVVFEYFVRWRQPLVEGPSLQLIEIRSTLQRAFVSRVRMEEATRMPDYVLTAAVAAENKKIMAAIAELEGRITYNESTVSVVAPSPTHPHPAREDMPPQ